MPFSQKAVVHRDDDNADQVQARIYAMEKDECVLQKNFQREEINLTGRR